MTPGKTALRQQLRDQLAAVDAAAWTSLSGQVLAQLVSTSEYRSAEIMMIFLSMTGEVDTTPLAMRCWEDGKRVLAPKVSWEQRRMMPVEIKSLDSDVRPGPMGIREPIQGPPLPIAEIDLVLVPGLGFDEQGNRLGRGRGFYDRFLSHADFQGVTCAFALERQVVEHVPHDAHDVRVQMLVTEERVRRFDLQSQ